MLSTVCSSSVRDGRALGLVKPADTAGRAPEAWGGAVAGLRTNAWAGGAGRHDRRATFRSRPPPRRDYQGWVCI